MMLSKKHGRSSAVKKEGLTNEDRHINFAVIVGVIKHVTQEAL